MRRRSLLALAGVAALVLWRRARSGGHVEIAYDDGSLVRLERGVEADDLLRDANAIFAASAR